MYLLDKVLQLYSSDNLRKLFLYDIGCTLKHHLKVRIRLLFPLYGVFQTKKNPLADKFKFAVPVFHSYGHVTPCQVNRFVCMVVCMGVTCVMSLCIIIIAGVQSSLSGWVWPH